MLFETIVCNHAVCTSRPAAGTRPLFAIALDSLGLSFAVRFGGCDIVTLIVTFCHQFIVISVFTHSQTFYYTRPTQYSQKILKASTVALDFPGFCFL